MQIAGTLATALGLSTTAATADAASTGASLNTTVAGASPVLDGSTIVGGVLGSTVISAGPSNAILTSAGPALDANIAALNSGNGVGNGLTNDTLVLNVDGTNHNVIIQAGDRTLASVVADINNSALNPGIGVTASISNPGTGNQKLVLTSTGVPGATDNVTVVAGGTTPELLTGSPLGFAGGETASGTSGAQNNALSVTVGNGAPIAVTLISGTYTAGQLDTQLAAGGVAATASLNAAGHLILRGNQAGATLTLNAAAGSAYGALGLPTGVSNTPILSSNENIQVRISGGGMSSPVTLALNPTVGGTTIVANVLADLSSKVTATGSLSAAGISLTSNSEGNNLVFTNSKGEAFQVAVTGDTSIRARVRIVQRRWRRKLRLPDYHRKHGTGIHDLLLDFAHFRQRGDYRSHKCSVRHYGERHGGGH